MSQVLTQEGSPPSLEVVLAGAARTDITPQFACRLAGYPGRTENWRRIHDRLEARALALRHGEVTLCILSLDVMAVEQSWTAALRTRALVELGVPPVGLMVAPTHTHSAQGQLFEFDGPLGPTLEVLLSESVGPVDERLRTHLADQAIEALQCALERLQPVTASFGTGFINGLGSNRLSRDSRADPRCLYVGFDTPLGEPVGAIIHYACHPTVLDGSDLGISADFPGVAVRLLDERVGGVNLFLNGALGDISTRDSRRSQDYAEVERFGRLLADAAEEARSSREPLPVELAGQVRHVALPIKDKVWFDGVDLRVLELRAELDAARHQGATHGDMRRLKTALEGAHLAQRLSSPLRDLAAVDVELQAFQLSPTFRLVAVPAEVFAALGLELSDPASGTTAIVGPANGYVGYITGAEGYAAGGYEVDSSLVDERAAAMLTAAMRGWRPTSMGGSVEGPT